MKSELMEGGNDREEGYKERELTAAEQAQLKKWDEKDQEIDDLVAEAYEGILNWKKKAT